MAQAQNAAWSAAPATGDFNTGANWAGGTMPTGTATFAATNKPSITFSAASTTINTFQFVAGAPGNPFTVFGATPQRDSAVIALSAQTRIAAETELYARYDGELGNGADNHALTAGLRMVW